MRDTNSGKYSQLKCCCNCYWNDYCCKGCNSIQDVCEDFTSFLVGLEGLDYIEQEYLNDLKERYYTYEDGTDNEPLWNDSITEAFLNGEDITDDKWWEGVENDE